MRDTRFPPRSQNNRIIFLIYLAIHISFANIFTWLAPWLIREVTTTGRDDLAIGYGNIKMNESEIRSALIQFQLEMVLLTEQRATKVCPLCNESSADPYDFDRLPFASEFLHERFKTAQAPKGAMVCIGCHDGEVERKLLESDIQGGHALGCQEGPNYDGPVYW